MKEGWERKKMSDVFDLQMGKTPDRKNLSYFGGDNIWVSISDIKDKYINSSKEHLTDSAVKETNIKDVQEGTVIMSFKLTVGRTAIAATKLYTNEAIMAFNVKDGFTIDSSFLYYYLSAYRWQGTNKAVMGLTLNKATISSQYISIPPLSVQESIVSELDMLSGIISKHKALQEEYDRLEQSIFYDMFGDPVTNEKGWEVKKLGEVCDKITDGTHNSPKNTPEGDYMYVTAKNIKKEGIILDDITYIDSETHKSIYARCTPTYGDILYIKDGATTGIATINQLKQEFSLLSSVALIKPSSILNNYYLKEVLNEPSMYIKIRGNMGGAAITRLTLSKINNIEIPLPPLSLQQSFADKISAIEQMKAKNKAAQEEAEMLFNERMAYYF